jgi:hypothetical protein
MRLAPRRALAACLLSGGSLLAWSVIPAASALTASGGALAATSSQCEPLSAAATPSPTASTTQAELCVSVQTSQSSITAGHAASYTVQVWAANGAAAGVSVTLTAAPQGEEPSFTGRCPSGDGSATCTIGSMATALAPSSDQMQAQIPVASDVTSITSVTLTATADAVTSPAMTVLPTAAETVAVSTPTAAASTPPASPSPTSTPAPSASPAASPAASPGTVPAVATTPTIGAVPTTPAGAGTSLISPAGVASLLPVASTPAIPAVAPAAASRTPSAGDFTLVIPMSTAELLGSIALGLVALFLAGKLVGRWLAARRAQGQEGIVKKPRRFGRWWPPSRWRAAGQQESQDAAAGTRAEDNDGVAAHSGADPVGEHQS